MNATTHYKTVIESGTQVRYRTEGRNFQVVKKLNSYKYGTRLMYGEDSKTSCVIELAWFNDFGAAKRFGIDFLKGAKV